MPGATPYITAAMLLSRPAGISWNIVPTLTANTQEQAAQVQQACWTATSTVDAYCRQPLRATVNTDQGRGPGMPRVTVDPNTCQGSLIARRTPILSVLAVQVSPSSAFPQQWASVPAGQFRARRPMIITEGPAPATVPDTGNAIDIAPGYIDWCQGRGGYDVLWTTISGWPHAGLAGDAEAGDTTLNVDDVTGWTGVSGTVYDAPYGEPVEVTGVSATSPPVLPGVAGTCQAGPGTVTLSAPLQWAHKAGSVISAMPPVALRAAALAATVEALETIDAIATQSLSGQMAGGTGVLAEAYELILDQGFRRIA